MDSRLLSGIGAGPDSGSYTDLNRLNQLKVGKDRDGEANIRKVAQEFESLFLNEMLKSMRSANEALGDGNFMNSQTTKQYQDMYDQQLSVSLSKNAGGIGLADVLVRQLSKMKQGSRGNGENPFARVAENGAGRWPSNPSAQAGKALPMPEAGRDDSKLLNQRRLALPGKLAERMLAGIVPPPRRPPARCRAWARTATCRRRATRRRAAAVSPPMASTARAAGASPSRRWPGASRCSPRPTSSSPPCCRWPRRPPSGSASMPATWWPRPRWRPAGANRSSASRMAAAATTCSASRPAAAGMVPRRALTTEYEGGKAVKEVAAFRSYSSFEQSFHDYVSFLQGNDRYQNALDSAANPERFMQELQRAGYATDPQYARKVAQIARQMQTYQAVAAAGTPPLG